MTTPSIFVARIGLPAPDFCAKAVLNGQIIEDFTLSQFTKKEQPVLLFFYPKDFSFVCPTEIHAFEERRKDFETLGVQIVGCSTDSEYSHFAWLQTPRERGGIEGIGYPLVSDISKTIADSYGVLAGNYTLNSDGTIQAAKDEECVAYRGLFFIDKQGVIQHFLINAMALGRSIDEALRVVEAWQHIEQYGEVCPANWNRGKPAFHANEQETIAYLNSAEVKTQNN